MRIPTLFTLVREPVVRPPGSPPLLLLLHGLGSDERDLFGLASRFDPRFLVASARAPFALGPGSWSWFQVERGPEGPYAKTDEAEASRLAILELIDSLVLRQGIDPRQVFLAGFSQGAIMGLAVALTRPGSIAALVAMSGRFPYQVEGSIAPASELEGLPVLVQHGTRDDVLPLRFGREVRDRLAALPVSLEYREYDMDHGITAESLGAATVWLSARLGPAKE